MESAAIERFSGPPLAERAYICDQARACIVRPGTEDLQTLVLSDLGDGSRADLAWDSWRRPDGRWTVVAALGGSAPLSTWIYDPRSRSVQPDDAASLRLASEDVVIPLRATTSTVALERVPEIAPTPSDEDPAERPGGSAKPPLSDDADEELVQGTEAVTEAAPAEPAASARTKTRKGKRASVPRWDEILFGAGQPDA